MIPDLINGLFEALAGLFVLNHCRVLLRDRAVAGVSIASTAFFTLWGLWNLWFYPQLGQFWSMVGGVFVVLANTVYVALLVRFAHSARGLRRRLGAVLCRFRGCRFNAFDFRMSRLDFCTCCGREIAGRTFADLIPMSDEEIEEMHRFNQFDEEHQA